MASGDTARPQSEVKTFDAAGGERLAVAAGPNAPSMDREMPEAVARILGRVVNERDEPVEGAEVFFANPNRWVFADLDVELNDENPSSHYRRIALTTDAHGRFELDDFGPGRLRYLVRAHGFAPAGDDNVRAPTLEVLDLGDIALDPALVLEGRVVDPHGNGVANAELARATTPDNFGFRKHWAPVARTGEDGAFRIDTLAPGEWVLRVESVDHPVETFEGAAFRQGLSAGHVFELERGWTIAGRLVGPDSIDGARFQVRARPITELSDPMPRTVDCTADGGFEFRGLRAADAATLYQIKAYERTSVDVLTLIGDPVEAYVGGTDVRIAIAEPATLRFELRGSGEPLADPIVHLGWSNVAATGQLSRLGGGRFEIIGIQAGARKPSDALRVRVDGYRDYVRFDLPLEAGSEADLGLLELEPAAIMEILAFDRGTDAPVEGVSIVRSSPDVPQLRELITGAATAHWDDRSRKTTTDANGFARVPLAEGFANSLTVKHESYATQRIAVDADADESLMRIAMSNGATVRVRTEDKHGAPVSGMHVHRTTFLTQASGTRERGAQEVSRATTAPDGVAVFEQVPRSRTLIAVESPTGFFGERTIEGIEGDDIELIFVVPAHADLEVLVRESGLPLVDAELRLCTRDERDERGHYIPAEHRLQIAKARTDQRGIARLEHAPVGEYALAILHAARSAAETVTVVVAVDGERAVVDLSVPIVDGTVRTIDGSACPDALVYGVESARGAPVIASGAMHARNTAKSPDDGARTDANGYFALRGLPANISLVVVAVPRDGVPVVSAPFTLTADEKRNLQLAGSLRSGSLDVAVEQERRLVEEVEAEYLGPRDDVLRTFRIHAIGGRNPHFEGLAPGPWRVRALASGRLDGKTRRGPWATVEVVAEKTATLVLTLPN